MLTFHCSYTRWPNVPGLLKKERFISFADLKSEQNVQKYFDPMSLFEMSLDEIGL